MVASARRFLSRSAPPPPVYNASWEDPRIDRQLLALDEKSRVVVLTGGGCNTLDYLADNPREVHAVDMNPAQNALLQLKLALIERGDFDDLYEMFGLGSHPQYRRVLGSLRSLLPEFAQRFWQSKEDYFERSGVRKAFYYRGTAGSAAWLFRSTMLAAKKRIRHLVFDLFDARTLAEQREVFDKTAPHLWERSTSWLLNQPVVMPLFGVPRTQVRLIAESHRGGVPWLCSRPIGARPDERTHLGQLLLAGNICMVTTRASLVPRI